MRTLLLLLAAACASAADPASAAAERTIIAHLMPTEGVAFHSRNAPERWSQLSTYRHAPSGDRAVLAQHDPGYLPYWDQPPVAAAYDLTLVRQAGIDAVSILTWGNPWDLAAGWEHAAHYWRAARPAGLRAAPDIWIDGGKLDEFVRVGGILGRIRRDHDAAWLRHDGRRAVFLCTTSATALLPYGEAMAALCAEVPRAELSLTLVSNDGAGVGLFALPAPDWRAGADRFYSWDSAAWARAARNLDAALAPHDGDARERIPGCVTALALCRHFSDQAGGAEKRIQEGLGGFKTGWFWQRLIAEGRPTAYLTSWNDLSEDHALMPESNHGWAYFELTRHYARWFHSGQEPRPEREQVLLFHHPQPVAGVELPPGRLPFVDHRLRDQPEVPTTPPTDYLEVVTLLHRPATVSIRFGASLLASRELPAGTHHWLLYHPSPVAVAKGWSGVYPAAAPWLDISVLAQPFADTQVHLEVQRDGRRLGFFRSHRPIAAAAARSDLSTVGNVFTLPAE